MGVGSYIIRVFNPCLRRLEGFDNGLLANNAAIKLDAEVVNVIVLEGNEWVKLILLQLLNQVWANLIKAEYMLHFQWSEDFADLNGLGECDADDVNLQSIGRLIF